MGVEKLAGGWRVSAVLSADRTETRGVSVCGHSVDRNSYAEFSEIFELRMNFCKHKNHRVNGGLHFFYRKFSLIPK